MQIPLQISFRGMEPSEAVEANVREKAEKLDHYFDRIMGCRVMVEAHHHHHHKGSIYHVRIDITVPGHELVVSREPTEHQSHEDVYVAIRDAFDAAKRQLEDHARRRRGDVKTHEGMPEGQIARLMPAEGYGIIAAADGREIYFHRNSVVDADFDSLQEGQTVRFVEEQGEKGPQASTVHWVG